MTETRSTQWTAEEWHDAIEKEDFEKLLAEQEEARQWAEVREHRIEEDEYQPDCSGNDWN